MEERRTPFGRTPAAIGRRRFRRRCGLPGLLALPLAALSFFVAGTAGCGKSDGAGIRPPEEAEPRTLPLAGDVEGVHDPSIAENGGTYFVFSSGEHLAVRRSTDLLTWERYGVVFPEAPGWVPGAVPEAEGFWAPDVSRFGGRWRLYYAVSSWASSESCIGHATNEALDAVGWVDRGPVVCSGGPGENWNAIDPNVVLDGAGTPWLSFGSFMDGIKMLRLDPDTGMPSEPGPEGEPVLHSLARRPVEDAIEAPFIVRRGAYYYLFVSFDFCCRGADSTYRIMVGRSSAVTGPYADREGTPMLLGGGTLVLEGEGRWRGPGHNAVLLRPEADLNVYHVYDASNAGTPNLRISTIVWDGAGWPVSGGP